MHQYKKIGGGKLTHDGLNYMTWELKICPNCGIIVKESYEAEVLSEQQFQDIVNNFERRKNEPKK